MPQRQTTAPTGPSDPRLRDLTESVTAAYARYERQAGAWQRQYRARGGQIYCAAGCFACCNMPVRVSLAEAVVTAQALSGEQAQAVEAHARAALDNARTARSDEEYVQRHRTQVGYCPLLERQTGACSQYAARPTRCRDTFSAFPAVYCEAGTWERLTRRERAEYRRQVARTPGTDGEWHFLAPLEHLSEPVWDAASRAMRRAWGLEVWGDFWLLTTLAADPAFLGHLARGEAKAAWQHASARGLAHPLLLDITSGPH